MHAAGCTGSQSITGQNGRQEPRKENPKPTTGKLFVAFRDKSGNNLTIRHHCVYSSALQIKKHGYSIQTSTESYYSKFER